MTQQATGHSVRVWIALVLGVVGVLHIILTRAEPTIQPNAFPAIDSAP